MIEAVVEARVIVGDKQLAIGFACDPADKDTWSRRAEAARWSLEQSMAAAEFADALRQSGSMHGAPADPEAFG